MEQFDKNSIKLIVGLGNPGNEYADTYHNVGIQFLKFSLIQLIGNSEMQLVSGRHFKYTKINDIILAEPISYMNDSGKAVKEILHYFKILPEEMILAHDEVDIDLGEVKLTKGQGTAGHKGVASTINELKTSDFWRLRIGIKKESSLRAALGMKAKIKAGNYVLKKISKHDQNLIDKAFEKAIKEIL